MCKNRFSKIFKKNVARVKFTRVVQGGPGGSRGSPGGCPGRSRGPFWGPGRTLENWGRHSGGSLGGARSVEKSPGTVFLRFLKAKYTYFQCFEHVNFVHLMWPLGAPGRSWKGSGRPRELQSRLWGAPGGSRKKGFGLRGGAREPPVGEKRDFEPLVVFPEALQSLRL